MRFSELKSQASDPPPAVESAGRVGARLGKVSELTIIVPLAPGGAKRLRAFLQLLGGNLSQGADKVGTLHDMRFVFFDNDTRLLFATAYDGDWDAYIDDFVDEDSRLPGHHRLGVGRLARHSPSGSEGLPRQAPDHGGRLVRRLSGSDGGGDSPAQAHRQGGRRIPRQGWLGQHRNTQSNERRRQTWQRKHDTAPEQDQSVEKKIQQLRRAFTRDAPEMAKVALEHALPSLKSQALEAQASQTESAGRIGIRQGSVSELTVIAPFAPGGARRLRAVLRLLNGNFSGGKKVGTLHDMRFVFLDNDTKFLFATAYDGEWDPYIDDFATKIPDEMDIIFSAFEGWPGIHSPEVKDWIVKHQIPAEGWYVAHPDLTVAETGRLKRVGKAVDEFLDKIGG